MDWVSRSDFDASTVVALWSMLAAGATTVMLFIYTMGRRYATVLQARRRRRIARRWRLIFARATLSEADARGCRLPVLRRSHRAGLLDEWNRACDSVVGTATDNLRVLAQRIGVPAFAERLLRKRGLRPRILAVKTLGRVGDAAYRDRIAELVDDDNTALSITAAVALVELDAPYAIGVLVPKIPKRRDWPAPRVSLCLRIAGSECIGEPMFRAIRSAGNDDKAYLLKFSDLLDPEVLDVIAGELLRESNDPALLKAALKRISGLNGIPRVAALTRHETWFVRMHAARALGRIATEEHVPLLENLLSDREWWVRYRAAQAIVGLPFLRPDCLRGMQLRQHDPYARDILMQACAEADLA